MSISLMWPLSAHSQNHSHIHKHKETMKPTLTSVRTIMDTKLRLIVSCMNILYIQCQYTMYRFCLPYQVMYKKGSTDLKNAPNSDTSPTKRQIQSSAKLGHRVWLQFLTIRRINIHEMLEPEISSKQLYSIETNLYL